MSDTDRTETPAEDVEDVEVDLDLLPGEEEEREPVEIHRAPPRVIQGISMGAAVVGTVLTTVFTLFALPFGFAGLAVFAGGLFLTHSVGWLTGGVALVLLGSVATGAFGAVSPELMLIGIAMLILAWDVGQHGIVLGEQLGRETPTLRNQLIYTSVSMTVIGLLSAILFSVFLLAGDGRPAPAVAVIILGVLMMAWVYRS